MANMELINQLNSNGVLKTLTKKAGGDRISAEAFQGTLLTIVGNDSKLQECTAQSILSAATAFDLYDSTVEDIAEELQDLITVCTSYLDYLGFDQKKRIELTKHINDKNRQRGYFEED